MNPQSQTKFMTQPPRPAQCLAAQDNFRFYTEGTLSLNEARALEAHLGGCPHCREELQSHQRLFQLMNRTLGNRSIRPDFDAKAEAVLRQTPSEAPSWDTGWRGAGPRLEGALPPPIGEAVPALGEEELVETGIGSGPNSGWDLYLGAAPWWFISTALHGLLILLIGLVTMAVRQNELAGEVVVTTELAQTPRLEEAEVRKPTPETRDILESKHLTPATDPDARERSEVVVPPDILAQAELGDHFETINPDRPDTQSAFGSPDAHLFHSAQGSDDVPGGGGTGGLALDEVIGIGGGGSPGSGGGWGGGSGTGVGVDKGSGRGSFGQRTGGGRRLMVKRHGGGKETESAVDAALYWLARHQEGDGHWEIKKHEGGGNVSGGYCASDEAVSALAVLAFLGAGHTQKVGQWRDVVRIGIQYLASKMRDDPHHYRGYTKYDLAISTLALAESFAMAKDPKVGEAAQKGVDHLLKLQEAHGGWNHDSYQSTSVLGWCVMAVKSAKVAGLKIPASCYENAVRRLKDISEPEAEDYNWGLVGYTSRGSYPYGKHAMTAVGMTSLQFLGLGDKTAKQSDFLVRNPPQWKTGDVANNFYYWYYGTLGVFQSGGPNWKTWNEALKATLLPHQCKGGPQDGSPQDHDGSWDPVTFWDATGGRVYVTAMGALCLEVYYRYLPLYR